MAAVSVRSLNTPKCTAQALRSTNQRTSDSVKITLRPNGQPGLRVVCLPLSPSHSFGQARYVPHAMRHRTRTRHQPWVQIKEVLHCTSFVQFGHPSTLTLFGGGDNHFAPSVVLVHTTLTAVSPNGNHLFNTKFRGFLQKPFKSIVGFGGCDHKDKAFGPNFFFSNRSTCTDALLLPTAVRIPCAKPP